MNIIKGGEELAKLDLNVPLTKAGNGFGDRAGRRNAAEEAETFRLNTMVTARLDELEELIGIVHKISRENDKQIRQRLLSDADDINELMARVKTLELKVADHENRISHMEQDFGRRIEVLENRMGTVAETLNRIVT